MGFDQHVLQLLLNVAIITGLTSLALLRYLRRLDENKKVLADLSLPQEQASEDFGSEPEGPGILNTPSGGNQDIRQYVARRSREWASAAITN